MEVRKWLRRIGKEMGQVYQCWWKICWDINVFFQVRISHVLRFIFTCDLFADSPSYVCMRASVALGVLCEFYAYSVFRTSSILDRQPMNSHVLSPRIPPIQWVPGPLSPGVKRPGREVDYSLPTSAEVKKMWIYTSTPHTPSWRTV
jgi:hypothetical protein